MCFRRNSRDSGAPGGSKRRSPGYKNASGNFDVDPASLTPFDLLRRPRAVYAARYQLSREYWSATFLGLVAAYLAVMMPAYLFFWDAHQVAVTWLRTCMIVLLDLTLAAMFGYSTRRAENYWLAQADNEKPLRALSKRITVAQTMLLWAVLEVISQVLSESGGIAPIYQRVASLPFDPVRHLSLFVNCTLIICAYLIFKANKEYAPYERQASIQ